jgi:D-alanyl-D-alanine carboxypeptidase
MKSSYEDRVAQTLRELGIPATLMAGRRRPLWPECEDLVSIGQDLFGREQRLERQTALQWQAMRVAARRDGIELVAVSGYRSFDYQRTLIERKLAAGLTIDQIMRVSALPGFSEHHTGRAIDIGTPGSPPLVEAFSATPAFAWLTRCADDFGFRMTYPQNNQLGVAYEPWHWVFRGASDQPSPETRRLEKL